MSDSDREDTSAKFVNTAITLSDLRKHDATWTQVDARQQQYLRMCLLRFPSFAKMPYAESKEDPAKYTERFLQQPGAYGFTLEFSPELFCELAYEGFLSTSTEVPSDGDPIQVMLPWIDPIRNTLDFSDTHLPRQVRKKAKGYSMTVDTALDDVILGCVRMHGEAWLFRGLRWLLRKLFKEGYQGTRDIQVGVHTFELWEGGELVAGELGYTVGSVYTSMTGFRNAGTKGAGAVQLALTSALLEKMGYAWWDLGMVLKYKAKLGAKVVSRADFVERLRACRDKRTTFAHDRVSGQELLHRLQGIIGQGVKIGEVHEHIGT